MGSAAEVPRDLSPQELRVLGCLVEKEATTPDNYPLTLNSLRGACNQTTSRDPVVAYGEPEIEQALTSLRGRGLTRTVHSTSNRATKYRHVLPEALELDPAETSLLSVLMLRGPQTVGELKGRTERQHRFDSVDEVGHVLAALAAREQPLVLQLERQPGQKDARWVHLLAPLEVVAPSTARPGSGVSPPSRSSADPYGEATAEFYDLVAADGWDTFGIQLLDLLDGVDPTVGPIVDVGSGTGVGLHHLREAVPGARLFAIEPSKAMRVALHARLADDAELRRATTVFPAKFGDARLPQRAAAIVVNAALGHLSDAERDRLWRYAAERLAEGAPTVIGVLPPERPTVVPLVRYHAVQVGDHVYEGWQSGEPIDERSMSWTLIYKVIDGGGEGDVIAEHLVTAPWRCDGVAALRDEVAAYGLTLTEHDECVVVRRRSPLDGPGTA